MPLASRCVARTRPPANTIRVIAANTMRTQTSNSGWTEGMRAGPDTAAEARIEEDTKEEAEAAAETVAKTAVATKDALYAVGQAAGLPSIRLRSADNARINGDDSHGKRGKVHWYRTLRPSSQTTKASILANGTVTT